jgi:hypothetical protein
MSSAAASLRSVTTLDSLGWHQEAEAIGPIMVRMRAELGISQYGLAERGVRQHKRDPCSSEPMGAA